MGVYESYASAHGLPNTIIVMIFEAGGKCPEAILQILMRGVTLLREHSFEYLVHVLICVLRDDDDIETERKALSVRANMFTRRFKRASTEIKKKHFLGPSVPYSKPAGCEYILRKDRTVHMACSTTMLSGC